MIPQYSDKQLSILRTLQAYEHIEVNDTNRVDCDYLLREGQLLQRFDRTRSTKPIRLVYLSPQGESYLATLDTDTSRYDTPLKISKTSQKLSIVAIIISALALLNSLNVFTFISEMIQRLSQ
jgi:hypothetical protein|uniref:Uncharacterized protein n=1 Tax=virus sp. ctyMK1 TaxID=2828002 RepID=A0A8S5REH7_9VIRU|nr:MAG TPA: hypothetical protein [virus sp. ctyMK1]